MVVALHRHQRIPVHLRQLQAHLGQRRRPQPLLQLRTLHARQQVQYLHGREVTLRASTRSIHRQHVTPPRHRGQPLQQRPIPAPRRRLPHLPQPALDRLQLKAARAGRAEARLRLLRKLLRAQRPIALLQPPSKSDLRRAQPMPLHQVLLLLRHLPLAHARPQVRRLQPPRQKMPHNITLPDPFRYLSPRRYSRLPLLVERPIRSRRRTLQHHLAVGRQGRPQPGQRRSRIARPSAHLAAMQILQA